MKLLTIPEDKPDGAPEWMVSFADMITIMMSFFVIMFALASGDKKKNDPQRQAVIESLENRFGPKWQPFASWGLNPGNTPLRDAGGEVRVRKPPDDDPDGEMVKVRGKRRARIFVPKLGDHAAVGGVVYFAADALQLPPAQEKRLASVAAELAGKPQVIEVLGHASNRPLADGAAYRDRWDLAYARCRQIADRLGALKIEPQRLRLSVNKIGAVPGMSDELPDDDVDARVDIYLTDTLAEGFSKAAAESGAEQ